MKLSLKQYLFLPVMAIVLLAVSALSASASTVSREFGTGADVAGSLLQVKLTVEVDGADSFYIIDEVLPAGWEIFNPGTGDIGTPGHIKWAVLSGAVSVMNLYTVSVPAVASGTYVFSGEYGFDSDLSLRTILGLSAINVSSATGTPPVAQVPAPSDPTPIVTGPANPAPSGPNDTTPPVITLHGTNPLTLTVGSSYVEPGASASDNVDGTVSVIAAGEINTNTIGTYIRSYIATDTAGNVAVPVRRTVIVVDAPANSGVSGGGGSSSAPLSSDGIKTDAATDGSVSEQTGLLSDQNSKTEDGAVLGVRLDQRSEQIRQIEIEAGIVHQRDGGVMAAHVRLARSSSEEAAARSRYATALLSGLPHGMEEDETDALVFFITYGTETTRRLGAGERAGALNSFKTAFLKLPRDKSEWEDVLKISNGRFPGDRNEAAEEKAQTQFKKVYLRSADMANENDKAAVNVITYGLRSDRRNLESEKKAVQIYKAIFRSNPRSALDWDTVRAIAYSGAKK